MGCEVVVRELVGFEAVKGMFPLIHQLNPEIEEKDFLTRLKAMLEEGYRCIGAYRDGELVGVSGFWVGTRFWCGRFIEPDNVVVDENCREGGVGRVLMEWIEAEGRRLGCDIMKLETYAAKVGARAFYRRQGYEEPGIVMLKPLVANADAWLEKLHAKAAR